MADEIPLFEISWDITDLQSAIDSIGRGSYWAKGPYVTKFEEELEAYFGVEHAITVNSGTTALVAALRAAGIGDGDEVIVPSFTFIATANAVRLVGAKPVFADIETDTYGLDPADVRKCITQRTEAIVPVHCYGAPCRVDELATIATSNEILLIEDSAEAFGAKYDGRMVGTFGQAAALSFCQNKIVATGEGGAIITDDDEFAERIRLYRSHGRASSDYFESADSGQYVDVGTNIRMSDLTAAVGCAQLDRVDSLISGRRTAAKQLDEALSPLEGVTPHRPPDGGSHVYQLYTVEFADWIDRQSIIDGLRERGIASKIYWDPPVHLTNYYRETLDQLPSLPTTEAIAGRVLSLPMHPNLQSDETERIGAAVSDVLNSSSS